MQLPLIDLSIERVIRVIEENTAAFLLALGRAAGSEEQNDPSIQWTIGGAPLDYHNCVVRANLTAEMADQAILDSLTCLHTHKVPATWHVGLSMRPLDLGARLHAHGFTSIC